MNADERKKWLEERRRGVGGSDVAPILGISPWGGPLDVWLDKTGRVTDVVEEPLRLRMGREMEPIVAQLYQERTGVQASKGELIVMPDHPFVGTPDLVAPDRVIELKTADPQKLADYGEPGTDQIPEHYLTQVTWYMMLTGKQIADLAVLFGLNRFEVYRVNYNPVLGSLLQEAAVDFWDRYVKPDVQPPIDSSERARKWLQEKWPKNVRPMIQATEEDDTLAAQYILTQCEAEKYADMLEGFKNTFRDKIGDADGIQGSGWKATWKAAKDTEIINWKGVAEELHEVILASPGSYEDDFYDKILKDKSYTKPGARRFLFHTAKNKEA